MMFYRLRTRAGLGLLWLALKVYPIDISLELARAIRNFYTENPIETRYN